MQVVDTVHSECLNKEMVLRMQYCPRDAEGPNLPKCTATTPRDYIRSSSAAGWYQLMLPFFGRFSCLHIHKGPFCSQPKVA